MIANNNSLFGLDKLKLDAEINVCALNFMLEAFETTNIPLAFAAKKMIMELLTWKK